MASDRSNTQGWSTRQLRLAQQLISWELAPTSSPVRITVPGTCGELVQGWYSPWNEAVLVSCPIACYSQVTVQTQLHTGITAPPDKFKAQQAARLLFDTLGRPDLGTTIQITSQLLPSRGMASSTADVIGVLAGVASTLQMPLLPAELAHLACQIEPSDSTMFDQLTLFAYRGSGQARILGPAPGLPLLMLDSGITVDTLTYNARLNLAAVRNLARTTETALDFLSQGITNNDMSAIGAAASLSAFYYQTISHNPVLEQAKAWAKATQALGIVRAHSGSLVGLLYAPQTDLSDLTRWLRPRFAGTITQTQMTGGGYSINDHSQAGETLAVTNGG